MIRNNIVYIRSIATAGSIIATLLMGWPMVDEYLAHRRVVDDLKTVHEEHQLLEVEGETLGKSHKELKEQLQQFEQRSITTESMIRIRDRIVELVRDHGCRVRQISVDELSRRAWQGPDDDPFEDVSVNSTVTFDAKYDLVSTRLNLTIVGSYGDTRELCTAIVGEDYLQATDFISLQPVDSKGSSVQMELKIRFFGLSEHEQEQFDDFPGDLSAFDMKRSEANG